MSDKPLTGDLLVGAAAIAGYLYDCDDEEELKKLRRKIYGLAESQALPLFRLGREICGRKSTIREWMAAQEAAAAANKAAIRAGERGSHG